MKTYEESLYNLEDINYEINMMDNCFCEIDENEEIVLAGNINFWIYNDEIDDIDDEEILKTMDETTDIADMKFVIFKSYDKRTLKEMADSLSGDLLHVISGYLTYIDDIDIFNSGILVIDNIDIKIEVDNVEKVKLINTLIEKVQNPLYILGVQVVLMLLECVDVNLSIKEKRIAIEGLRGFFTPINQSTHNVILATSLVKERF